MCNDVMAAAALSAWHKIENLTASIDALGWHNYTTDN